MDDNKNKRPPESREVSEIDFSIEVLSSLVNFAMRNGCGITDALKMNGSDGGEMQSRAEKVVCKCIQTLVREITLREDNAQADPKALKQMLQWKIEL